MRRNSGILKEIVKSRRVVKLKKREDEKLLNTGKCEGQKEETRRKGLILKEKYKGEVCGDMGT